MHISSLMLYLGSCGQQGISGRDLSISLQAVSRLTCGRLPIAVAEKLPLNIFSIILTLKLKSFEIKDVAYSLSSVRLFKLD